MKNCFADHFFLLTLSKKYVIIIIAKFIEKYGSRIGQIHFKDIKLSAFDLERPQSCLTFLGNGDVDLKACAEAAKRSCAATVPFIYEQDLPDGDIAENAADSFAVLRDLA